MRVTIASTVIPDWNDTRACQLWVWAIDPYMADDSDTPVFVQAASPRGNSRVNIRKITCTVDTVAKTLTIPSIANLLSTTDSANAYAKLSASFFTPQGAEIKQTGFQSFSSFRLQAIASQTWEDVFDYNLNRVALRDDTAYSKDQSDRRYLLSSGGSAAPTDAKFIVQVADASLTNAQSLGALGTGLVKNTTTTGVLSIAIAGTDYQTPLVAGTDYLTPTGNGSGLTALNASNLSSGTVPDARLSPNVTLLGSSISLSSEVTGTLPIGNGGTGQVSAALGFNALSPMTAAGDLIYGGVSGVGTRLAAGSNAQLLIGGTTPSWGAVNLASMVSGQLPVANGGTGSATQNFVDLSTTQNAIAGAKTFTGAMTHIAAPAVDGAMSPTVVATIFRGADSSSGSPLSYNTPLVSNEPSTYVQTFRSGGVAGTGIFGFQQSFNLIGTSQGNTYGSYIMGRISPAMTGAPTGTYFHELTRSYIRLSPTDIGSGGNTHNIIGYAYTAQAERTVAGVRVVAGIFDCRNSTSSDAAVSTGVIDTTYNIIISNDGTSHNTGGIFFEGTGAQRAGYFGMKAAADSITQRAFDLSEATFTLQGTAWTATAASNQVTISSGGHADVEAVAGDWIVVNGVYCRVASATANAITLTGIYSSFGGSGTPTGLTITKSAQAAWLRVNQPISVLNNAGSARKEIVRLDSNDILRFDYDGLGSRFGSYIHFGTNALGAPSDTLTSGWRLVLYDDSPGTGDAYGFGVESGSLWCMSPAGYKVYVSSSTTPVLGMDVSTAGIISFKTTTISDSAGKILSAALNTVGVAQGGTGLTSYAVGDLLYASGTTTLAKLADVATGSVLVSGGVGVAPAWSATPQVTRLGVGVAADATASISTSGSILANITQLNAGSGIEASGTGASVIQRTFAAGLSGMQSALQVRVKSTSGTAAVGGGPAVLLYYDDDAANPELMARFGARWSNPANGSEAAEFVITTRSTSDTSASSPRLIVNSVGLTSLSYGTDVASAATITPTGNLFHVTGTTNITSVSSTGVIAGTRITMIFDGILTFTDGSNLKLAGNFVTSAEDTISLVFDGSNWHEVSRSVN